MEIYLKKMIQKVDLEIEQVNEILVFLKRKKEFIEYEFCDYTQAIEHEKKPVIELGHIHNLSEKINYGVRNLFESVHQGTDFRIALGNARPIADIHITQVNAK